MGGLAPGLGSTLGLPIGGSIGVSALPNVGFCARHKGYNWKEMESVDQGCAVKAN
jgi:hypothetical protein